MHGRQRKKRAKRLVEALLRGDAAIVGALLRAGAAPDAADREGTTPLYQASVQGATDLVRLLLAAGAAPDLESGHGQEGTPLCAAAAWGHTAVVRELLAHGADPNLREDGGTGHSPLDWALQGEHSQTWICSCPPPPAPSLPLFADLALWAPPMDASPLLPGP
ncbi:MULTISPECIES: ankyrin repeat domain-containing protein [unclassified Micromonospora]|uniref:ankyrin repeat domain-containing protein n=1 Tax=unclassified Micromonospora TaxID=2617518 RepID=UPI00362B04D3